MKQTTSRTPTPPPSQGILLQRQCDACDKKKKLQRKAGPAATSEAHSEIGSPFARVNQVLATSGSPLDPGTRGFLEAGFGDARPRVTPGYGMQGKLAVSPSSDPAETEADAFSERALSRPRGGPSPAKAPDFSSIRIHDDSAAHASAAAVGARAYTVGHHIVFGAGQFNRHSHQGRGLLAHEATHVLQQSMAAPVLQRDACSTLRGEIEAHPVFKTVQSAGGDTATEAKEILDMSQKGTSCVPELTKYKVLFETKDLASGASSSASTEAERIQAIKDSRIAGITAKSKEDTRVSAGEGKARKGEEEAATSVAAGWRTVKNNDKPVAKEFQINTADFKNILVKVKVKLSPANAAKDVGSLPADASDVGRIEGLEDAIEKVASTLGYSLNLEFVKASGPDVMEANVDLGEWINSGNWVGKDSKEDVAAGLAHELHHRLGLRDRYDYMSHASNETMSIPDRIHWFHVQMLKGGLDPLDKISLMGSGTVLHPDDICRVANGLMGDLPKDDEAKLAADPALKTQFEKCLKERGGLTAEKAKPAQDAAEAAVVSAWTRVALASITKADFAPLALKLTGETVTHADIRTRLTKISDKTRAAVQVISNRDKSCENDDGRTGSGAFPVLLCPAFFNKPLPEQTDVILRHASSLALGAPLKRSEVCGKYDCKTQCGKPADRWVHFIKCA